MSIPPQPINNPTRSKVEEHEPAPSKPPPPPAIFSSPSLKKPPPLPANFGSPFDFSNETADDKPSDRAFEEAPSRPKMAVHGGAPVSSDGDSPIPTQDGIKARTVPATVMVAASLLLGYGGLILFCSCSQFAIHATSARNQADALSQNLALLDVGFAIVKIILSLAIVAAGLGVFRLMPSARWLAFASLAADLLIIAGVTLLFFVAINMGPRQQFAELAVAGAMFARFLPFITWLIFSIPILVLLNSPSAKDAFTIRPSFR